MSKGWVCPRGVDMSRGIDMYVQGGCIPIPRHGTRGSGYPVVASTYTVDKRVVRILLECFLVSHENNAQY